MFEHSLGNYDIFPLLYECKPHKIRNFKFSENLRPKNLLIDTCPLLLPPSPSVMWLSSFFAFLHSFLLWILTNLLFLGRFCIQDIRLEVAV